MNLENQINLVQEKFKSLKNGYVSEVKELTSSPKCYLKRHLKMTPSEEKCLEGYPNEFLIGLVKTVHLAIENNWEINIDLGSEISSLRTNGGPTSIKYAVGYDVKSQKIEASVTKTF